MLAEFCSREFRIGHLSRVSPSYEPRRRHFRASTQREMSADIRETSARVERGCTDIRLELARIVERPVDVSPPPSPSRRLKFAARIVSKLNSPARVVCAGGGAHGRRLKKMPKAGGQKEPRTGSAGAGLRIPRRGIKSWRVQSFLRDDPGNGRAAALLIPLPAANFSPCPPPPFPSLPPSSLSLCRLTRKLALRRLPLSAAPA